MTATAKPSTTSHARESLTQRLASAAKVILANGWAAQHQIDHAVSRAIDGTSDHVGTGRFLVDQQVLSRDQASELDEVLKSQPYFPTYRLLRKLGSGGMGTVFLAEHLDSGRRVALKTMNARIEEDKDFIGRFHREAKALSTVKHPHIAEIVGSGENKGHCWLAMEFIDGPSLMNLLKDYRVLPEAYALRICRQVAEGLGHVWATAHLIHRDLKPENILVVRHRSAGGDLFPAEDVAKLIDFGLVKSEDKDDRLTQTGMTIGTPLYMSPEQVRGEQLDCRSDIYGLGATLYHLLTGTTPFVGTSPGSIMSAHLTEPVPNPGDRVPSLSPQTRDLVMMAMAKEAKDRFLSFDGMVKAIDEALQACGGKGGGTLRLLRKPLVLNKPSAGRKIQPENQAKAAQPAPAPEPSTAPVQRPATTPIAANTADEPHVATDHHAKPAKPTPISNRTERSKVFDEDPHAKLGIGVLPWVALAFAVVGLLLWLLLRA